MSRGEVVVHHTVRQSPGGLHLAEHVEQPVGDRLVADDRHAALLALVRIGVGQFECGAPAPGEYRTHESIGERVYGVYRLPVLVRPGKQVLFAERYIVEEDFALVEWPLADLVERLAARHTLG